MSRKNPQEIATSPMLSSNFVARNDVIPNSYKISYMGLDMPYEDIDVH